MFCRDKQQLRWKGGYQPSVLNLYWAPSQSSSFKRLKFIKPPRHRLKGRKLKRKMLTLELLITILIYQYLYQAWNLTHYCNCFALQPAVHLSVSVMCSASGNLSHCHCRFLKQVNSVSCLEVFLDQGRTELAVILFCYHLSKLMTKCLSMEYTTLLSSQFCSFRIQLTALVMLDLCRKFKFY